MSSQTGGEGEIRKRLVEADRVDCMVALPGQLFYATQIPACLWILSRDKSANGLRDRRTGVSHVYGDGLWFSLLEAAAKHAAILYWS